ncbi:MAG: 40S ribosomal protein S19 [Candidatus Micrarchaeia archaeon]
MANINQVNSQKLVEAVAKKLEQQGIEKPAYVNFVKSGAGKERVPEQGNFWFMRSASLMRQLYLNGPVGISRLRTYFGNRKRHVRIVRHHHYKAGGSIITDSLNALQKLGYVAKTPKGRVLTAKGRALLDKTANELFTSDQHA